MAITLINIHDEIDLNILAEIKREPGLNARQIGTMVRLSKYAVLNRIERLKRHGLVEKTFTGQPKTYLMYPPSSLTIEATEEARHTLGKNILASLRGQSKSTEIDVHTAILKHLETRDLKYFEM